MKRFATEQKIAYKKLTNLLVTEIKQRCLGSKNTKNLHFFSVHCWTWRHKAQNHANYLYLIHRYTPKVSVALKITQLTINPSDAGSIPGRDPKIFYVEGKICISKAEGLASWYISTLKIHTKGWNTFRKGLSLVSSETAIVDEATGSKRIKSVNVQIFFHKHLKVKKWTCKLLSYALKKLQKILSRCFNMTYDTIPKIKYLDPKCTQFCWYRVPQL